VTLDLAFGRSLVRPGLGQRTWLRRGTRLAGYPVELATFGKRLEASPPAALHLQWGLVPALEALAWRRLRRAGIPVIYTAHNILPHERRPWQPAAWRRLYGAVDRLIVHSVAARERLLALAGLPQEQVHVVPMAADEVGPQPSRAEARRALGLEPEAPTVLFFGHVRPYKGLTELVAAMPGVAATVPGARLLVVGPVVGGPRGRARLREALARAGPALAVELREGYVSAATMDASFAAADLVALPYRVTDDSAVLQAARARGRAVVATAVGGLPEVLAAGGGRLVPPGDVDALGTALIELLRSPAAREALEAEALAAAAARTWADVARETLAVYRAAGADVD
jgi:glycosyltransferase involved in cell wall biosynthesis